MKNIAIQLLILLFTVSGFACRCKEKSWRKAAQEADLIVSGKVISENPMIDSPGHASVKYVILVSDVIKGKIKTDTIKITTGIGGGDCGYNFKVGKNYIIYSYYNKYVAGEIYTDDCTRTSEFDEIELKKIKRFARRKGYS